MTSVAGTRKLLFVLISKNNTFSKFKIFFLVYTFKWNFVYFIKTNSKMPDINFH